MNKLIKNIKDYLEQPEYVNLLTFCKKYTNLSENLWAFADQDDIKNIEDTLSDILIKTKIGECPKKFEGLSDDQIKNIFYKIKIDVLNNIPENDTTLIKDRLNKEIIKNLVYAQKLNLIIPKKSLLSIEEYYKNSEITKKQIPILELKTNKGLNK